MKNKVNSLPFKLLRNETHMLKRHSFKRFLHLGNFVLSVICYFKLKKENTTVTEIRENKLMCSGQAFYARALWSLLQPEIFTLVRDPTNLLLFD